MPHMLSLTALDHLEWISQISKNTGYSFGGIHKWRGISYYDCMLNLYQSYEQINNDAQRWYDADKLEYHASCERRKQHDKAIMKRLGFGEEILPLFITLGFNHQTWTINSCLKVIETITTLGWIKSCRAVFEVHRENGFHPHCHIYIEPNERLTKSKVLEKLWAVKGIKKVILSNNGKKCSTFIDYKLAEPRHIEYIMLRKQCKKMPFVELDNKWREENNIPIKEVNWNYN